MTRRALMATLAGAAVAPMLPVKLTKDEWMSSVIPPITPADIKWSLSDMQSIKLWPMPRPGEALVISYKCVPPALRGESNEELMRMFEPEGEGL